jgi:hypothetical protein
MRRRFREPLAALFLLLAGAGCAPDAERAGPAGTHPNLIIVREFTASAAAITLDPSFGFSLHRGSPGVPLRQRAASVGRAAAFNVADAIVQQLRELGYDAVRSDGAGAEAGGRALIVSGVFRQINEGYRRRVGAENASLAADIEIDYQAAEAAPQRLMAFTLDSRQVPREPIIGAAARRGADVNGAAVRLGHAVARTAIDVARRNNWPGASR